MDRTARSDRGPGDRLLCDVMLGRLARWLRALGHDTAYDHAADDAGLLRRAARERRILVTRDTRIAAPPRVRLVLLHANDTPGQLRELAGALDLGRLPERPTRCLACNARLRRATPEEVEAGAPDHVRATQKDFRVCRGCGRVYWPGTHRRKLEAELTAALPIPPFGKGEAVKRPRGARRAAPGAPAAGARALRPRRRPRRPPHP